MPPNQLPAKAQAALGLPDGFKTASSFPFEGMNVQSSSIALKDTEFGWLENFARLGDGNLRTLWDVGPAIYTVAHAYFSFYSIGTQLYAFVANSDGSGVQVNMTTFATTPIAGAGTFYQASTGYVPCAKQWGTQYLLISNRNTVNDFWAWDGALLYSSGSAAPNGVTIVSGGGDYGTNPTITVTGGYGGGLTLQPVVLGGQVAYLNITSPGVGYQPGDQVVVNFSGGGSDTSAVFAAGLTPIGVGGVSISSPGFGYTSVPAVSFTGGSGAGAAGTAVIQNGQVINVNITAQGNNYVTAPTVTLTGGGGTGATAVAQLATTGVANAAKVSGGSGYTSVPLVTFVGGGGAGATGVAVLTGTSVARVDLSAGGSNYDIAPVIQYTGGGGGTGFAATANLYGDTIGSVTVTNGGSGYTAPLQLLFAVGSGHTGAGAGGTVVFSPTSVASITISSEGQFYTTAPSIQFSAGANRAAFATVTLMPYGVSGSAMETYFQRLWIVNGAQAPYAIVPPGGTWQVSAAESFVDFATSDGGVQAVNADSFLQVQYTNVHQSSGYLYFFGDGSVSVVSNVSTSQAQGSTVVSTQYNYQNVDPQSGTPWRDTLQDFGRSSIVTNSTGVYGLYGGTLSKISGKLDQLFTPATQGGLFVPPAAGGIVPTSAIATIFNVKHYLVLLTVLDPDTAVQRNVMVTWNEKDWTISSQSVNLISISTQKVGSSYYAFGSDGSKIYPLFAVPSSKLAKRFDTKQYGADRIYIAKRALGVWMQAQDNSNTQSGIVGNIVGVASGIALQSEFAPVVASATWGDVLNIQPAFKSTPPFWSLWGTSMGGIGFVTLGLRFTSSSPDFTLGNLVIGYRDETGIFGQ